MPLPSSLENLRKSIRKLIEEGCLKLGEALEPKQYKRLVLRNKEIVEEVFMVSGRKYPLADIREKLLAEHESKGLMRDHSKAHLEEFTREELNQKLQIIDETLEVSQFSNDELMTTLISHMTKRHLIVWQDHSSLANHGHLLLMIRVAYDRAVYHTPAEMHDLTGKNVDVQEIVERPAVYLLARASDTVLDKLSYIETRTEDIRELSTKVRSSHGTNITDVMRLFCGDHPEMAFEKGQQEGGDFPCAGCESCAKRFYDIEYTFRQNCLSMEEHRQKVFCNYILNHMLLLGYLTMTCI